MRVWAEAERGRMESSEDERGDDGVDQESVCAFWGK